MENEERVLFLEKSKRGLLRIVFGRTGLIILLLLLQIAFMVFGYYALSDHISGLWLFNLAAAVVIGLCIFNDDGNPSVKLTWLVIVLLMPVFGLLLYLYMKTDLGSRLLLKAHNRTISESAVFSPDQSVLLENLKNSNPGLHNISHYTRCHGGYPVYMGTDVKYFPSGEEAFAEMLACLEQAEEFIFLEYFIIDEGYMWGRVLDVLERKVRQGIEVRMIYDGTCSLFRLPYDYPQKLRSLGIKCKVFSPIRPFISTSYNNRDHRKILVVDGRTAFTGGINLADEYINRKKLFGHWKDTAIMLKGEAVQSFTLMFLQIWNLDEKKHDYLQFLGRSTPVPSRGYVIPYGDSPLDKDQVGKLVYLDIINRAKRYVHIMTPYLVLDNEMLTALCFAAERGVDVEIIIPHVPDKHTPFALAYTHYARLIGSGVHIYEYTPGFIHAKVFVSDDIKAVVGTINLDYRSLYYHFECAAYLYDVPAVKDIEADFIETRQKSMAVTAETMKKEKFTRKFFGAILKIIAPLT